jgi:hypothetical protein
MSIRDDLIKLGTTNPELRPHIRKILAASVGSVDIPPGWKSKGKNQFRKGAIGNSKVLAEVYEYHGDWNWRAQSRPAFSEGVVKSGVASSLGEAFQKAEEAYVLLGG